MIERSERTIGQSAGPPPRPGPAFWIGAAAGWALIAVGLRGVLVNRVDTRPASLARFVLGGALVHDLALAPLVIAAGWLVARAVRGRARPVVQAGLVISSLLVVVAWPLVRGYGRAAGNPTSLPHDYGANLALVVGLVWAAAAATIVVRHRARRHR